MKRSFPFILILLFFCSATIAQLELRLSGGINSSTYSHDFNDIEFQEGWGYQFGADIQIGNLWYLQTGLFFETLENSIIEGDFSKPVRDIQIERLRAPLYIGHRFFNRSSLINLRIFTGPNASIVVNSRLEESLDLKDDDFNQTLVGWNLGAGLDLAFLFVDAGYMFGLNDAFIGGDSHSSNNLFFANAGIRIKF